MRTRARALPLLIILSILAVPVAAVSAEETGRWTLDDALKQIDSATKGVKGLTADISVVDVRGGTEERSPTGKAFILTSGKVRLDAAGEVPKTFISYGNTLYIHRPADMTVEQFDLRHNRARLAPYTLLGFSPRGEDLTKDYLLTLLDEGELDARKTLLFEITPQDDAIRTYIPKIHLWIDQATWLPVQQRIFHSSSDTHLTVTYKNATRDDRLKGGLFSPKWPKGTEVIKK